MLFSVGTVIRDRYRIDAQIGVGGMGAVYRVWDNALQIPLALKVNQDTRPEALRLFEKEAQLLAALRHPSLPRVIDHFVVDDQGQFLVMDYAEGESLSYLLEKRGGPLGEAEILPWIVQVCDALDYLHHQNPPVIHRDVKPANIIITPGNRAMLVDFGIAKQAEIDTRTTQGARMVTPGYSAPEQYGFGRTDARSDVYSLGATVYELLTGQQPPESINLISGISFLAPLEASAAVKNAVLKAMAPQVSDRLQSAAAFAEALQGRSNSSPTTHLSPLTGPHPPFSAPAPASSRKGRTQLVIVLVLLTFVVLSVVGVWVFRPAAVTDTMPLLALGGLALFGTAIWLGLRVAARPRRVTPSSLVKSDAEFRPQTDIRRDTVIVPDGYPGTGSAPSVDTSMRGRTVVINIPAMIAQRQGPVFDELILHDSYDRLKSFVNHSSGGRFVLTGYGRFGGTSLVTAMMRQTQRSLIASGEKSGALPVFYFEVKEDFRNQVIQFKVTANESSVGVFQADMPAKVDDPDALQRVIHTQTVNKSLPKSKDELRRMIQSVMTRAGQKGLPARTVIVLDRIRHLETLEVLSAYDLFEGDQVSVVAVTRKEDADQWPKGKERLDSIGFQQWYVPCLWNSGGQLRDTLKRVLFTSGNAEDLSDDEKMLENVLKHFEYQGRGILGDTLDGIKHPDNWYADNDRAMFAVESVWKQPHVRRNAWLQDMLDLNWPFILGNLQVGSPERIDRARLGIYNLVDWMTETGDFTTAELRDRVTRSAIALAANTKLRDRAVENLVYVLERNRFLKRDNAGSFEVVWRLDTPPPSKIVRRDPHWAMPSPPELSTGPIAEETVTSPKPVSPGDEAIVRVLSEKFNMAELEELADQLRVNWENVEGESLSAKARGLAGYLNRRGRQMELVEAILKERPGQL